jgi:hypothetical protein
MSTSRRKFLRTGLLAAVVAALPAKYVLGQSWKDRDGNPANNPPAQTDPLALYTKATFKTYLNSIFQLQTFAGIVPVTLLEVGDLPAPKGGECFSLLFRGGSRAFRQETYTLVHPSLGTFQLLLVPAGADENGAQGYLATINRLSFADAVNSSAPTKRSGSMQPTATPTPIPAATPATLQPAAPSPKAPKGNSKPPRKRKPSWKSGDNEDLDLELNDWP